MSSKVFLALPLIALAVMFVLEFFAWTAGNSNPLGLFVLLVLIAGYLVLGRRFIWSLADEVYDCGDSLLVRRGSLEERIAFANIVDVTTSAFWRPSRVTIYLATPGVYGNEVAFVAGDLGASLPFFQSGIPKDLRDRARRARSGDIAA